MRVGVDIVEIARIERAIGRYGERFLARVYTEGEIAYCRGRPERLAARWAAKEAGSKALGTGWHGIGWREVEVSRLPTGQPTLILHGRAQAVAQRIGLTEFVVSLAHDGGHAIAVVIAS